MKRITVIAITTLFVVSSFAQDMNNIRLSEELRRPATGRKEIRVPDILGYKTLKCDFHMHTVFSDGSVWPTFRVDEAWEEGLDAISITDHIENNPSKRFVGGDHNSPYDIALGRALEKNIILVRGGEISRGMPPGHFNALFVNDVNPLNTEDYMDAFKEAARQGAFIKWNHPGWKAQQPDTTMWWNIHQELYEKGLIHGIEVFNEVEWYPIALDWCIEKNLAVTGNSDIHGVVSKMYNLDKYHRPMTLVFAKDRSEEAIKEAMFDQRTVAFFTNTLIGKEEFLKAIFEACVVVGEGKVTSRSARREEAVYSVKNNSDIKFTLSTKNSNKIVIPANSETQISQKAGKRVPFIVENMFIGGTENLKVELLFE